MLYPNKIQMYDTIQSVRQIRMYGTVQSDRQIRMYGTVQLIFQSFQNKIQTRLYFQPCLFFTISPSDLEKDCCSD
jgi:hypothetical protein